MQRCDERTALSAHASAYLLFYEREDEDEDESLSTSTSSASTSSSSWNAPNMAQGHERYHDHEGDEAEGKEDQEEADHDHDGEEDQGKDANEDDGSQ